MESTMSDTKTQIPEVVMHSRPSKVREDGSLVDVWTVGVLGGSLPDGMFGSLSIESRPDGSTSANVTMQGHSRHGRRYGTHYGPDAGIKAQAALLAWARRKLREFASGRVRSW
jgi:hypothetical protein